MEIAHSASIIATNWSIPTHTTVLPQICLCVEPAAKLVLAQTALEDTPEIWRLWAAVVAQFG